MEASDRPVASKRVRPANSLQDGDNPVGSSVHSEVRLDDLHQLERCISSSLDAPRQPQFSSLRGGWTGLSVLCSLFRSFHGSSGVYEGHGACVAHASLGIRML